MTVHKWVGHMNHVPGEPDDYVEYCDTCGAEKVDEDSEMPSCEEIVNLGI